MTKSEARALRDEIKANGIHCVIQRGDSLPSIMTTWGEFRFASRDEWLKYLDDRNKYATLSRLLSRRRSGIEIAIDQSCGITPEALKELSDSLQERSKASLAPA